jgi:hypothetical protein
MLNIIRCSVLLIIAVSVAPTYAHHSFAATFSDQIITVEGTVERLKYSNPHVIVYFNVNDENGEETQWLAEGGSATTLRRNGWNKDTLIKGDYIRITGESTRNGSPMVSMQESDSINFVDPSTGEIIGTPGTARAEKAGVFDMPLQLANGLPNISGAWTGEATGRVGRPILHVPPMDYNEIGAALQAEFDPVNDPQVQCEPPGLVRQAGFSPHPVRIEQYDDHVVLNYEEYAGLRTIYFDDRDLVGGEHTHLGQSIARYEGQKLIIESSHLLPNLSATTGNPLTDQTTTVETYYRQDELNGRAVLRSDMLATDPGYLLTPWTISWSKYAENDYGFIEVECKKPLTN